MKLELLEQLAYQFSCEYKEIFSMRELLAKIEVCKSDTALKHHAAPHGEMRLQILYVQQACAHSSPACSRRHAVC